MKKKLLLVLLLGCAIMLGFTSCDNGGGGGGSNQKTPVVVEPEVVSVTITCEGENVNDKTIEMFIGDSIQLNAVVEVKGEATKDFTWSITGSKGTSAITEEGLLTIGSNVGANAVLVITATSDFDPTFEAKVSIKCIRAPAVNSVTITTTQSRIDAGDTLQFAAMAAVVGEADNTIIWSLDSTGHQSGTSLSATGLLTVDAAEPPYTVITVTATSDFDDTKFDSKNVVVNDPNIYIVEDFTSLDLEGDWNVGGGWYDPKGNGITGHIVEATITAAPHVTRAVAVTWTGNWVEWAGGFGCSPMDEPVSSATFSKFTNLTFWARRAEGATSPLIRFAFAAPESSIDIATALTDEWQKITIPISSFSSGIRNNGATAWLIASRASTANNPAWTLEVAQIQLE